MQYFGGKDSSLHRPYLLPRDHNAIAVASLRHHVHVPPLKISDPAARAMTDFQRDPMLTVTEERGLEQVLDEMFRLGVRAFLVARERIVTGLLTAEHARTDWQQRREHGVGPLRDMAEATRELRVADVMTPSDEVPAVDWQMIAEAQIRDLIEIFEGSGALHLVVLENERPNLARVRGFIHRDRLERQLAGRWALSCARTDERR